MAMNLASVPGSWRLVGVGIDNWDTDVDGAVSLPRRVSSMSL